MTASTKETAAALRKELKAQFPGTKFSVTMARGSAYGWLRVEYTDGPKYDEVTAVTRKFEASRFDGMTDSYVDTGNSAWQCCGVNVNRDFSEQALADAEGRVQFTLDGTPFVESDGKLFAARYPHTSKLEMARLFLSQVSI